jgi:hypothetical protein
MGVAVYETRGDDRFWQLPRTTSRGTLRSRSAQCPTS